MQSSQRKKRKRIISSTSSSPAQVATRHVPTASFCPLTACPSEPLCSPPLPWLVLDGVSDGQRAPPVNWPSSKSSYEAWGFPPGDPWIPVSSGTLTSLSLQFNSITGATGRHTCTCKLTCECVHANAHAYVHPYVHVHTHIFAYTHSQTHGQGCRITSARFQPASASPSCLIGPHPAGVPSSLVSSFRVALWFGKVLLWSSPIHCRVLSVLQSL